MTTDTRGRLLQAALELLEGEGVEALTLRAIARRTGVSHGAPLKHFPHRAALLSAVATQGFGELQAWARRAIEELPETACTASRLRAGTRAYVAFAEARPQMFALMFRRDLLDDEDRELGKASLGGFEELMTLVQDHQAAGWRADADTRLLTGALWSAMHGLAQLWSWGALPLATKAATVEDALDGLCRAFDLTSTEGQPT
ncbi:TetR/AcrR family transcriptional regulator [Streptomyces sp. A7024]|uniref:TetR/AcrR family transcriptional regulator n=1 Tax=Streptomyces coryli TaxID=1128680 RepID=A0A6G4TYN5_9ACTN|nr:TetR/AcrR family transcriptional regulator [Streptomyces coryli]